MQQWKPTEILEVAAPLGTSTGPARVETDLGPAYAKFVGNPEGPHTLFCELVGVRAAAWLGLPTFDYALIPVPQEGLVQYKNNLLSKSGPAFATRLTEGVAWGGTDLELKAVENPEAISGLVVLDTWLLNCDRFRSQPPRINVRNVFLASTEAARGKYRLVAMDHTHCFTCGRELTTKLASIDTIRHNQVHGNFPAFQGYVTLKTAATYLKKLGRLDRESAGSFVAGTPREWEVNAETQNVFVGFLVDRAKYLAENCAQMLVDQLCVAAELDLEGTD